MRYNLEQISKRSPIGTELILHSQVPQEVLLHLLTFFFFEKILLPPHFYCSPPFSLHCPFRHTMAADRSKRFVPGLGIGTVAIAYVCVDYLQHVRPTWHDLLMPAFWVVLVLSTVYHILLYRHWSKELRSALPFLGSVVFLLLAFLFETISVRFVTAVLGLDWHRLVFSFSLKTVFCFHLIG